jgi:hypothetical protein
MANITLTIPLPLLTAGQHFKTRYHSLPAGVWSSYVNRSNSPFTLTGLSTGNYELEVILVNADDSECPATYKLFSVKEDYSCIDFTAALSQTGSLFKLTISYTLPGGFTNPPCGWDIIITDSTGTKTIPYASLPVGGIVLSVNNTAMTVKMRANLCYGDYKYCYQGDISPIPPPPCTPLKLVALDLLYNNPSSQPNPNTYFIRFSIINSIPASKTYHISYQEGSPGTDSGTFSFNLPSPAPGTYMYSMQVHPTSPFKPYEISYTGSITDDCGVSHPFSVMIG